jgi:hypothetical protein
LIGFYEKKALAGEEEAHRALRHRIEGKAHTIWYQMTARTFRELYVDTQNRALILQLVALTTAKTAPLMFFYGDEALTGLIERNAQLKVSAGVRGKGHGEKVVKGGPGVRGNVQDQPARGWFPPGLYGTTIGPWRTDVTRRQLAKAFYGANEFAKGKTLEWFVAFVPDIWEWAQCGELTHSDTRGLWHWVRRAGETRNQEGTLISIDSTLMLGIKIVERGKSLIPLGQLTW